MPFGAAVAGRLFLSTSPARGTTEAVDYKYRYRFISIHVPREGDD